MKKQITIERLTKVIIALHKSPNQSMERTALWIKLVNLRSSLKN